MPRQASKKSVACKEMTIHCIVDNKISFCNQKSLQRCRIAGCCPIPAQLWTQLDSYMLFLKLGGYELRAMLRMTTTMTA
jgi:hypothetical protein